MITKEILKNILYILLVIFVIAILFSPFYLFNNDNKDNYEDKIVYSNSKGRLGNQMFIVASTYGLAKSVNKKETINGLDKKYSNTIFKDFKQEGDIKNSKKESEKNFTKDCIKLTKSKGNYLVGSYLQNENYFKKYKDEIIHKFTDNDIYKKCKQKYEKDFENSYFIHIRLGDYVKNKTHYVPLFDFYRACIFNIKQQGENPSFKIFSNNINKCKNGKEYAFLKEVNHEFVDINDPLESIYAMSLCKKGAICANSSFSWWGSYLNQNENKKVYLPSPWINSLNYKETFVYPENSIVYANTYPLTVVSGYWKVKNKHNNKFNKWFNNTMAINNPMIFFGSKETIELIKPFRTKYPTKYIELDISSFKSYKFKNKIKTSNYHIPSNELGIIWHEKIFNLQRAKNINTFNSKFFMWYDAGYCSFRNKKPSQLPLSLSKKIKKLNKNKVLCETIFNNGKHKIQGGTFIIHKDLIDKVSNLYLNELENNDTLLTDQEIFINIKNNNEKLFKSISKKKNKSNWGQMVKYLQS